MQIQKGEKTYAVKEFPKKWTVELVGVGGKLSIAIDVPKELCGTEQELRDYVLSENNSLF